MHQDVSRCIKMTSRCIQMHQDVTSPWHIDVSWRCDIGMHHGRAQQSCTGFPNMSRLLSQIERQTRLGTDFTMGNLTLPSGYAKLHGPTIKAATTRGLVPWLVEICEQFNQSASIYDRAVTKLIRALDNFYKILYGGGFFLTDEEKVSLKQCVLQCGKFHHLLNYLCRVEGQLLWAIRPKSHYFQHIPYQGDLINPRHTQNYLEEGLIGKVTQIWQSTAKGPQLKTGQRSALVKSLTGLIIRLKL